MVISLSLSTAGYDYTPGPYTVDFTAGQMYATLMVSTMDDNTTELSEYFSVMITSTDQPGAVIVPPSTAFITIEDNDPGTVQINEPDGIHMHVLCTYVSKLLLSVS